jgi:hypothetical protein
MFSIWRRDGGGEPALRACIGCKIPYPLTVEYFKQHANSFQKTCKVCLQERSTARKDRKREALEELHPNQACRPRIEETRYTRWDNSQQSSDTFQTRKAAAAKARTARFNNRNNVPLPPSPIAPPLHNGPLKASPLRYDSPLRASPIPNRSTPARSQPLGTAPRPTIDTDYGPHLLPRHRNLSKRSIRRCSRTSATLSAAINLRRVYGARRGGFVCS